MHNILSPKIKNQIKIVRFYFLSLIILFNTALYFFIYVYNTSYIHKELLNNILKYKTINLSDMCKISNCESILLKDTVYNFQNNVIYTYDTSQKFKKFSYNFYDILKFKLLLNIPKYNIKIKTKPNNYLKDLLILILIFNLVLYLVSRRLTMNLLSEMKKDNIISMSGKETYLANKNMTLLTSHITHEVKTPLAVLNDQLHQIKNYYEDLVDQVSNCKNLNRTIDKLIIGCSNDCKTCSYRDNCILTKKDRSRISNKLIDEAFNTAEIYIDAIQNVLSRMQSFKEIKYSNGNKDLYELIHVAFKTLSLYHKGVFEYKIDKKLYNIHISEKLANADILHIFLNHIKNSLQANATYINIEVSESESSDSKLVLYMTDNGNGIPIDKLQYIFNPKVSTKSHKTNDGIGLYISKQIILEAGGDENVQESSTKGTVFKFILPIYKSK